MYPVKQISLLPWYYLVLEFSSLNTRSLELIKTTYKLKFHIRLSLGDNDRAARVLFVQHPREQGEWCSQNPSVARVLT